MTNTKRKIAELIFSNEVSNYQIAKVTGISQSHLSLIRKGKRNLGGISLEKAEIFEDFYKKTNFNDKDAAYERYLKVYGK